MSLSADQREAIDALTTKLADDRGGDYTYDQTDAGYYGALDDLRALAGLAPTDRSKRADG